MDPRFFVLQYSKTRTQLINNTKDFFPFYLYHPFYEFIILSRKGHSKFTKRVKNRITLWM